MDARSRGDRGPFIAAMAEDVVWRIIGSTAWSDEYVGKADIQERLVKELNAQLIAPTTLTATRILADGDYVVMQCTGDATRITGERYANTYCFVIRMQDGKVRELTEYMDTALVERVLQPPSWRVRGNYQNNSKGATPF